MSFWFRDHILLLKQGVSLLETLTDEIYLIKMHENSSSTGEHFRHIIEHYHLFIEGINNGYIDYDKRKRDLVLQSNLLSAIDSLKSLVLLFEEKEFPLGPLTISQNYDPKYPKPIVGSSVERELMFLVSHTVHHFAIIGFLLKSFGIEVPQSFGYSPATLFANAKPN